MNSDFDHWLYGVPVIPLGDSNFNAWGEGMPFVDTGAVGAGPGVSGGARIVSPRRERVNQMVFGSTPWHVRKVSPMIPIGRSPA